MVTKIKKVSLIFCSAALVFAAAGCVGSADPVEPTPTASNPTAAASSSPSTTSPSPSIKPTPKPIPASSTGPAKNWPVPVMPEAAKSNTKEGIAAFTKYYFALVDYTVLTYDTKPIKAITERSCYLCATQIIDPGDRNRGKGNWHVGGTTKVSVNFSKVTDSIGISGFTFTRDKTSIYLPSGKLQGVIPATTKASPGTLHLSFVHGWKVADIEFIDTDGKS